MYLYGHGVTQNVAKARELFGKAADQGYKHAQQMLIASAGAESEGLLDT